MSHYENHRFNKDLPIIYHLDYLSYPSEKSCISNWHDNVEIICCIEGEGWAVVNSASIPLKQGNIMVINSGDIHYITTECTTMTYYCLIIYTGFLKEFGIDVENTSFCENVTDATGLAFFEKLARELSAKPPYYQSIVKGEIISYLAYLCRHFSTVRQTTGNHDRIKQGLTYIREHFTEDLTVETIASQAGFSRFYFSRQFKSITGMTVIEYVLFLRCRHAKELLSQGQSVSKAALECGFSDLSYFTKVFKRFFGVLPSKVSTPLNATHEPNISFRKP